MSFEGPGLVKRGRRCGAASRTGAVGGGVDASPATTLIGIPPPPLRQDKRGGAVIEGKAKRYKTEDGPEAGQQYSAAQVRGAGGLTFGSSSWWRTLLAATLLFVKCWALLASTY